MVTSSNARMARDEGQLAARPSFSIDQVVTRPQMSGEDAHGFLAQYAASFASQGMEIEVMRFDNGSEAYADEVLVQFGRQFVVLPDMKPAARRRLWALARSREAQIGMPVVLARSEDASQWECDAPHVYVVEVTDALRGAFARVCEAKAMELDELECVALVYLPAAGSGWEGKDGRKRVSQLDSDVQYLLPMVAPLRRGQGEAWYHTVRAAVRHLWQQANPPVRTQRVPLDEMDAAEYASLMATGGEEVETY